MAGTSNQLLQPQGSGDKKVSEDYLRRYEDQTLKAMENHSNAFGQALIVAYLLFPARAFLEHRPVYQLPLIIALYAAMTYNMMVLGSLAKDVVNNAQRIRMLHVPSGASNSSSLKLIKLDSSRIKLAGPLGPLQWASLYFARKIADSATSWTFWPWLIAGFLLLSLILIFLLFPLAGFLINVAKKPWGLIAILFPSYYGTRLCFRFARPLIYQIRYNILASADSFQLKKRFVDLYTALSEWFDRDKPEDGDN